MSESSVSVGPTWTNYNILAQGKVGFTSSMIIYANSNSYGNKSAIWYADAEI